MSEATRWMIGSVEVLRVPYFDTALPADAVDLVGVADGLDWAEPWLIDDQPGVGQAFWVIRSAGRTLVVDPCGASDVFIRRGPEAVGHQEAAFASLRAAGCEPSDVDAVVLTHLDGIGMAALADGSPAGEEQWTPAFTDAPVIVSRPEYETIADDLQADEPELMGAVAFAALDALGAVRAVATPHELAPGVTLRLTEGHGPGHCVVEIESDGERAVMLGHLAVSPLHAGRGVGALHVDPDRAWTELCGVLDDAARDGALVMGALWPHPGAARVGAADPYELRPAPG